MPNIIMVSRRDLTSEQMGNINNTIDNIEIESDKGENTVDKVLHRNVTPQGVYLKVKQTKTSKQTENSFCGSISGAISKRVGKDLFIKY